MEKDILLFTSNVEEAEKEIEAFGGQVYIVYNKTVIVACLPQEFDSNILRLSSVHAPDTLDDTSRLAVDAWNEGLVGEKTKIDEATAGLPWDAPGYHHPLNPANDPELARREVEFRKLNPLTECIKLVGKFALGLVLPSGKRADFAFSVDEKKWVIGQVTLGIQHLRYAEPLAGIQCCIDIQDVEVDVEPTPGCDNKASGGDFETCEAPLRDQVLELLGFSKGWRGQIQYVKKLKDDSLAPFAYVAFITKYPLYWFAYAYGDQVFMNFYNDNWGYWNIHTVFTHETCHVFRASDEYQASKCTCEASLWGCYKVPNYNCVNCGKKPLVSCIMLNNVLEICPYTRGQMGWNFGYEKIEAAVSGQRQHTGAAYVFGEETYTRWDWAYKIIIPGYPKPVVKGWKEMPDDFKGGFDAVLNGAGSFDGLCFFLKGDKFVICNWETERCISQPRLIKDWVYGLPEYFHKDLNSAYTYGDSAYLFKGEGCAICSWKEGRYKDARPIIEVWDAPPGFTENLDALINEGHLTYIFKGEAYYIFDHITGKRHVDFAAGAKNTHDFIPGLIKWPMR